MLCVNLKRQCLFEFIGTAVLILIGTGVVASLVLGNGGYGQWEISLVWGLAVTLGILVSAKVSGAHLNPAVSIALVLLKKADVKILLPYILAQCSGAFFAALLVFALYQPLFTSYHTQLGIDELNALSALSSAGVFSTFPHAELSTIHAFFVEAVITAFLMFGILAITDSRLNQMTPAFSALFIGLLVALIGSAFGKLTGFAMNPARDFGPRLMMYLMGWGDIVFTANRAGGYFWVPIVAPIVGACGGGVLFNLVSKSVFDTTKQDKTN